VTIYGGHVFEMAHEQFTSVADHLLIPEDDRARILYDTHARKLVSMFRENFKKFEAYVGHDVLAAAPELSEAAE